MLIATQTNGTFFFSFPYLSTFLQEVVNIDTHMCRSTTATRKTLALLPLLLVLLVTAGRTELRDGAGLNVCGWPAVYEGGRFGPPTVTLVQLLLFHALGIHNQSATGKFTSETTRQIEAFQQLVHLTPDGFLGPETWPLLVGAATPLKAGSEGQAVQAVQVALTSNGFATAVTGTYDPATIKSLSAFQLARGDPSGTNGTSVALSTWHLLATGCNTTGSFWFDAGWPQGVMTTSTLSCMRDAGFAFSIFECWVEAGPQGQFWSECVTNIQNAREAGFQFVGAYMFAQRYYDPTIQAQQLLANLSAHNATYDLMMLDIEGPKWSQYTHAENRAFITALRDVFDARGVRVAVYCGSEWPDFFGSNFTLFSSLPVIYAHYDNIPSYYDFYPSYGGWTKPSGKQFWDGSNGEVICNSGAVDWDWSETPFWV